MARSWGVTAYVGVCPRRGVAVRDVIAVDLVPAALRGEWSRAGHYPDADLYALFDDHARSNPSRDAVVDDTGTVTYADLAAAARRVANQLADAGIRPGEVVAVQLANSWPDELLGERVCACVVARPFAPPPDLEGLRAHLLEAGLDRHRLPERLEVLPVNASGKVVKRRVLALLLGEGTSPADRGNGGGAS